MNIYDLLFVDMQRFWGIMLPVPEHCWDVAQNLFDSKLFFSRWSDQESICNLSDSSASRPSPVHRFQCWGHCFFLLLMITAAYKWLHFFNFFLNLLLVWAKLCPLKIHMLSFCTESVFKLLYKESSNLELRPMVIKAPVLTWLSPQNIIFWSTGS